MSMWEVGCLDTNNECEGFDEGAERFECNRAINHRKTELGLHLWGLFGHF